MKTIRQVGETLVVEIQVTKNMVTALDDLKNWIISGSTPKFEHSVLTEAGMVDLIFCKTKREVEQFTAKRRRVKS